MPEVCGSCVLLVDDDPSIRELLSIHLEKVGLRAIHAEDGIDALVRLRETLPRVIVTDMLMPRMTGWEFIAVVRRRFPTIPVVVMSESIPIEFSEHIKPDCWFEKSMLGFPEFVRTVNYLAQKAPNHIDLTQVISLPIRARLGSAGYIDLTCPDCLRSFEAASSQESPMPEQTAVCVYCQARVPFVIESSESE